MSTLTYASCLKVRILASESPVAAWFHPISWFTRFRRSVSAVGPCEAVMRESLNVASEGFNFPTSFDTHAL